MIIINILDNVSASDTHNNVFETSPWLCFHDQWAVANPWEYLFLAWEHSPEKEAVQREEVVQRGEEVVQRTPDLADFAR